MEIFRFSVFTATYNRASFLPRVYRSLVEQTYKDFEWIVVDDGSTDNTEDLIQSYINAGELKLITYKKKENGGKHTAWREATKIFQGKYVISIDSDDSLLPNALEIFDLNWRSLENSDEYQNFWEVKARGCYEDGSLVGNKLPEPILDIYAPILTYKYDIRGDLHGCRKASVLRNEAKVPDYFIFEENCSNFQEHIRWFRAGRIYKTRYIEEFTMIVSLAATDRLSRTNKGTNLKQSYNTLVSSIFDLNENKSYMKKWKCILYYKTIAIILYMSFRLNKNPFKLPYEYLNYSDKIFMILGYIPIYFFYIIREKL